MENFSLPTMYQTERFQFLGALFEVSNRIQTKGDAAFQECTTKQWYLLSYVMGFQPNAPTLSELANSMGTSHQNTRQMVKRLEEKGYLVTTADGLDRRKLRICLTEKTEKLIEKYQRVSDRFVEALFYGCTDRELASARAVIEKMNEFLQF